MSEWSRNEFEWVGWKLITLYSVIKEKEILFLYEGGHLTNQLHSTPFNQKLKFSLSFRFHLTQSVRIVNVFNWIYLFSLLSKLVNEPTKNEEQTEVILYLQIT